ncbi:MAG: hypothetical protein LQ346_004597 [Caloplaca aetnensis]|nr:MAG: hypothetical protein LQ346_004597 [Caloplaca aetnensis]
MSQFPGRQHANGQRTYNPSSNSPFTTPERQQSGYQPSPASQTPSHRQLAERSLSRQMSGLSIPDNNISQQEMYNAVSRDLVSARARCRELEGERTRYLDDANTSRQVAEQVTSRCQALESELSRLGDELADAKRNEVRLQVELETVRGDLRRARQTIQQQSRAIEGRRPIETTIPQQPASGVVSRYVEDFGFGPRPVATVQPDPRSQLYAPATSASGTVPRIEWAAEFTSLFKKIERFCRDNMNVPDEVADEEWPSFLADTIARESSPEHVTSLVVDHHTRYLLVTRIILDWVESHFFKIKIIKGFSPDYDSKIYDLHRKIKSEPSVHLRRGLTQAECDTILELTQQPSFPTWRLTQIREAANLLLHRLRAAIKPHTNRVVLGETFASILADAFDIGLKIATRPLVVHMWFPPCAESTLFNPRCMLHRNVYAQPTTVTPDELEKRGARVGLGITPHITVADLMEEKGEAKTVHLADVVVRPNTL